MTLLASTCASLCQTPDRFCTITALVLFSMETLQTNCFPDNMDAFLLEFHCFFWNVTPWQLTELISLFIHLLCQGRAAQLGEAVYLWGNVSDDDNLLALSMPPPWFFPSHLQTSVLPHLCLAHASVPCLCSSNHVINLLSPSGRLEPGSVEPTVLPDSDVLDFLSNR